jgi:hypothetical protein
VTTCRDARELVKRGQRHKVEDHLGTCASCAAFAEAFDLLGAPGVVAGHEADLDETFQAIEIHLRGRSRLRTWLADQPTPLRLAEVLAVGALVLAAIWVLKRRADWEVYPILRWLIEASGLAALVVAYTGAVTRPLYRPPYRAGSVLAAGVAALCALAAPLLLPLAHEAHPESLKGLGPDLASRAIACYAWGSAIGAGVATAAYLVTRGVDALSGLSPGLFLLLGLFSALALHIHCPIVHPLHIALGHTSVTLTSLMAFLVLRRFLLRR